MKKNTILILLFVLFPLVVSLACTCGLLPIGRDKGEEAEEAVIVVTEAVVEEESVEEVPTVEEIEPIETEEVIEPTEEEMVVLSPENYLIREKDNWADTDDGFFVAFELTNQTQNLILTGVEYEIRLLDSSGEELRSDWYTFPYVFPQQTTGVFYQSSLSDEDPPIETIEITHGFEESMDAADYPNPISIEKIKIWEGNVWPIVTGVIKNTDSKIYTDIRASILCYNQSGEIIGGGYEYTDFVLGEDQIGFHTYIDTYDEVASMEVFPMLTYSSNEYEDIEEYRGRLSLVDQNFYMSTMDYLYGGAVIQNNLEDEFIKDAIMVVTYFDSDGYVTGFGNQYIDYICPGERLGVSPTLTSQPKGATSAGYDIYLFPGELAEDFEITENIFQVNATELMGDYNDEVKVSFTNTYSKQVTEVDIYVLVYDSNDVIIGGGNTYYDEPIPPGGSAEYEVYVSYNDDYTVAEIEAWVVPSYWTTFE